MKQNLANSIILPPKNGGLKAWSHGVRKANYTLLNSKFPFIKNKLLQKRSTAIEMTQKNTIFIAFLYLLESRLNIEIVNALHVLIVQE